MGRRKGEERCRASSQLWRSAAIGHGMTLALPAGCSVLPLHSGLMPRASWAAQGRRLRAKPNDEQPLPGTSAAAPSSRAAMPSEAPGQTRTSGPRWVAVGPRDALIASHGRAKTCPYARVRLLHGALASMPPSPTDISRRWAYYMRQVMAIPSSSSSALSADLTPPAQGLQA